MKFQTAISTLAILCLGHLPMSAGESKLKVHLPQSMKSPNPDGYDHREALFGQPPYGGSITEQLYYVDADLCNPRLVAGSTTYYPSQPPLGQAFLLMINRGECTFVKKVRNAQHMGAAGVLIADNICLCTDEVCLNQTGTNQMGTAAMCEPQEPLMADDGSGSDITIPSYLLAKHDGDAFKKTLVQDKMPMRVEMAFSSPPDMSDFSAQASDDDYEGVPDVVKVDVWVVPSDNLSMEFLHRFKPVALELEPQLQFTPHMYIYDGVASGCQGRSNNYDLGDDAVDKEEDENDENEENALPCYNLCTNQGRYCATDPDDDLDYGVSGANVVEESLRQLCIFDQINGGNVQWWNYVTEMEKQCFTSELFHDTNCRFRLYEKAGIDASEIVRCMSDSGGLASKEINSKLETELNFIKNRGIHMLPTIQINDTPYSGPLKADAVFTAICAQYYYETKPGICHRCANCADAIECVINKGECPMSTIFVSPSGSSNSYGASSASSVYVPLQVTNASTGGVSHFTFVSSVLLLAGVASMLAMWHYRRSREEMRSRVRGIMADYMPLHDNGSSMVDFQAAQSHENSLLP